MAALGRKLQECCQKLDMSTLLTLIEQGVPVDWSDETGRTALQICSALGWVEGVAVLLENGANVNVTDNLGWTALMQAAGNGRSTVMRQLIAAGGNLHKTNINGWGVCGMAVASKDVNTIQLVLSLEKSHLDQALLMAAQVGDVSTAQLLINEGVDPNLQLPDTGVTSLMLAAGKGHTLIIELLLSNGADPDITNTMHMTALDVAIRCGHVPSQKLLAPVTNLRSRFSAHIPLQVAGIAVNVTSSYQNQGSSNHFHSEGPQMCPENPKSPLFLSTNASPLYQYPSSFVLRSPSPLMFPQTLHSPYSQCFQQHSPSFSFLSPNYSAHSPNIPYLTPNHQTSCFEYPSPHFMQQHVHHLPGPSSPIIPGWIFPPSPYAANAKFHLKPENVLKSEKRIKKWWKQIKMRCKGKKNILDLPVKCEPGEDVTPQENMLETLLLAINLEKYYPVFKAHKVDVPTFLTVTENDLEEMGILDPADCSKILLLIKNIRRAEDNDNDSF